MPQRLAGDPRRGVETLVVVRMVSRLVEAAFEVADTTSGPRNSRDACANGHGGIVDVHRLNVAGQDHLQWPSPRHVMVSIEVSTTERRLMTLPAAAARRHVEDEDQNINIEPAMSHASTLGAFKTRGTSLRRTGSATQVEASAPATSVATQRDHLYPHAPASAPRLVSNHRAAALYQRLRRRCSPDPYREGWRETPHARNATSWSSAQGNAALCAALAARDQAPP